MSTLKTVRIKGQGHISEIQKLFRERKTWHMPFRFATLPDYYDITLRENDPMLSYLLLKYSA